MKSVMTSVYGLDVPLAPKLMQKRLGSKFLGLLRCRSSQHGSYIFALAIILGGLSLLSVTISTLHIIHSNDQAKSLAHYLPESIRRILCSEDEHDSPYITLERLSKLPDVNEYRHTPTHISLCRELLDRAEMEQNGNEIADPLAMTEDKAVCMDWTAPHAALMEIFASSVVAHVGRKYNMSYKHNCERTIDESDGEDIEAYRTIQQQFPSSSLILDDGKVDEHQIMQLCRGCLVEFDGTTSSAKQRQRNAISKTHHCLLYPGSSQPLTDGEEVDSVAVSEHKAIASKVPLAALMPTVTNRLQLAATDYAMGMENPLPGEEDDGVVIFLDDRSDIMDSKQYLKHMPPAPSSIEILISPSCADSKTCSIHASKLCKFLEEHFPDAEVRLDIVGSTAASFSRMIEAKYLICPPGTTQCLLPALAKEQGTYAVINESASRANTLHWFDFIRGGADHIQVDFVKRQIIGGTDDDTTDPESTLDHRDGCTEIRGKMGSWEHDYEYLDLLDSSKDLRGTTDKGLVSEHSGARFQPVKGSEGLAQSKWTEGMEECDLDLLNIAGLCQVVKAMKLHTIQFVGDEYTEEMVKSFWRLLGLEDPEDSGEEVGQDHASFPKIFRRTVHCEKELIAFDIVFTPNDKLQGTHRPELPLPVPHPHARPTLRPTQPPIPNVYPYNPATRGIGYNVGCACYPWVPTYLENQSRGRQMIIGGMGASTTSYEEYCNDFDNFQRNVNSYVNPTDIVVYRSALPMHGSCACQRCGRRAEESMSTEDVERANNYVMKAIDEYKRQNRQYGHFPRDLEHGGVPSIHFLDVALMAVSHPHAQESSAENDHGRKLCEAGNMEYAPQYDAMNHMLYANMVDYNRYEKQQNFAGNMNNMNLQSPYAYVNMP